MFDTTISNLVSSKPSSTTITSDNEEFGRWYFELSTTARLVVYVTFFGTIIFIIFSIFKFLRECEKEDDTERLRVVTGEEEDEDNVWMPLVNETSVRIENGDVSTTSFSSLDDVDYSKLCVICFEERRNCFFVPCGHSATCRGCANKILSEESKVCPICRRVIRKSKRLVLRL